MVVCHAELMLVLDLPVMLGVFVDVWFKLMLFFFFYLHQCTICTFGSFYSN